MVDATRDSIRKETKIIMKFLNQYLKFAWKPFADGKRFMCIGTREWIAHSTKEHLGTLVDSVIVQDRTDYGREGSNLYEKVTFKVAKDIEIPMNVEIVPKNVVAVVYGEYRNQLSCTAEEIEVVSSK